MQAVFFEILTGGFTERIGVGLGIYYLLHQHHFLDRYEFPSFYAIEIESGSQPRGIEGEFMVTGILPAVNQGRGTPRPYNTGRCTKGTAAQQGPKRGQADPA